MRIQSDAIDREACDPRSVLVAFVSINSINSELPNNTKLVSLLICVEVLACKRVNAEVIGKNV